MSITRGLHKRYLKSMENKEEGFTLIELLVVLLIIGILLAIAIPTFLSTTKTAAKTSAQSNLQTALTGADAYWTQANQTFAGIDSSGTTTVSNISAIDTGMTFVSGTAANSSNVNVVSLWTDHSSSLVLAAYSPGSKDCWYIIELKAPATIWGISLATGTWYSAVSDVDASACVAQGTPEPTGAVTPQTGGWPSV